MQNMPEHLEHLPAFRAKMEAAGLHPVIIDTFAYYYHQVVSGETGLVPCKDIEPVPADEVADAAHIGEYTDAGNRVLKNAIIIKLNGGLGTSMGLTGPKSLLKVKDGLSFLEIMLLQAEQRHVKMALMNSFSTHDATLAALAEIQPSNDPLLFLQNKFPKILQKNLAPATWPGNSQLEWNPPGHGDIYSAVYASGMLKNLLDQGIIYAFISNSDNLGATMDTALLGYFAANNFPFMMEVARRTPSDIKGGHLARYKDGCLMLREAAQCPPEDIHTFQDINFYGFFNTNNIWVNLKALRGLIEKHGTVKLPMICNPKTLDPRDPDSPKVYQLETAMGAAISLFEGATVIKVPFSRFLPVKKCADLLAIRSDRFVFSKAKNLILSPRASSPEIKIDLDSRYFGKMDLFDQKLGGQMPSLIACAALTVQGDVLFENNVRIKGRVVIKNNRKTQAVVREGTVIDKDLIFN